MSISKEVSNYISKLEETISLLKQLVESHERRIEVLTDHNRFLSEKVAQSLALTDKAIDVAAKLYVDVKYDSDEDTNNAVNDLLK